MPKSKYRGSQSGFLLPFCILISAILLTTSGFWYQQVILQSFIAERLLDQHKLYIESQSLIPFLKEQLDQLSDEELLQNQESFKIVEVQEVPRWRIERSMWKNQKIRFAFHLLNGEFEPLMITINYNKNR